MIVVLLQDQEQKQADSGYLADRHSEGQYAFPGARET